MQIEVINWEKYNPRKDVKHSSWLRLENKTWRDPKLFDLSNDEKMVWIAVLCIASEENKSTFFISINQIALNLRIKTNVVEATIEKLQQLELVHVHVTDTLRMRDGHERTRIATNERTNVTNERNEHSSSKTSFDGQRNKFDFNSLYQKYPRKVGKQQGIAKCKVQVKTPEDFDLLSKAIDNYTAYCKKQGTEAKYIKHFSTFMTSWRDWLDDNAGDSDSFKNDDSWILSAEELEN